MAKTKRKRKPLSDKQKLAIEQRTFSDKIRKVFTNMGFHYYPTVNKELEVGCRKMELDSLFVFENVWIVCEDTISKADRDHIRNKNETSSQIKNYFPDFFQTIVNLFPEAIEVLCKYDCSRIQFFYLYIPRYEPELVDDDYNLYSNLKFMMPNTLNYFNWLSGCIKYTARHELFRFLEIQESLIGLSRSSGEMKTIQAPIIYPKDFTGRKDKVRIVSFMMSAEDLMDSAYVLRKDNWEKSIFLYQRLINKDKIKKIRSYVEQKGEAFYNNIIVALPNDVSVKYGSNDYCSIASIRELPEKCDLVIPKRENSICIIDGQHRVFAHYESGADTPQEKTIAQLRKQLHLLVTGLVFDNSMTEAERIKAQSEIFLDINSNSSPVPPNVLLQIKRIMDPVGNESLAQLTIEKLNSFGVFKKMFQLSALGEGRIKTASIIQFALKNLVSASVGSGKKSLYDYWEGDKAAFQKEEDEAINSYVEFCAKKLNEFFCAVKSGFKDYWNDPNSKILSVVSINGFIIAYTRLLQSKGIMSFDFYNDSFVKWDYDFSKEKFEYTSSQYRKFSTLILKEAFNLSEEELSVL